MKNVLVPLGMVLVLIGAVWTLQGFDVWSGSSMSGKTLWAVVGPVVALLGLGAIGVGIRARR
jgi:hypothetical protein